MGDGPLDGLKGGAGNVLSTFLGRGKKSLAEDVKAGAQDALGEATGGLLGNRNKGQTQQRPDGVQPRQASATGTPVSGLDNPTQNFLQQFGQNGQPARPSLAETLNPMNLLKRGEAMIMPSDANMQRLRNAGTAIAGTVASGVEAVRRMGDTSPEGQSGERQAEVAAPEKPGFFQRLFGGGSTAAVATTVAITTAAAQPIAEPPVPPQGTTPISAPAPAEALQRVDTSVITTPVPAQPAQEIITPTQPTAAQIEAAVTHQRPTTNLPDVPASTVSTAAAVTTPVKPTEDFTVAATATGPANGGPSPAKPSATVALDSLIDNEKDASRLETLMRARAQVAKIGEPGGMS